MALSDLQVYSEYAHSAFTEVDMQNTAAFNEAARGTIVLRAFENQGNFSHESFFAQISNLVRVRNPNSITPVASVPLTQAEAVSVKVARGTPPVSFERSNFEWIKQNPADAGVAYGTQMAKAALAEKLNSALGATYAALATEGTNVFNNTAVGSGTVTWDALVSGQGKMGDASQSIMAWVMHSKNMTDIQKLAYANGSNLFMFQNVNVMQDGMGRIFVVTDAPSLVTTVSGPPVVSTYHILGLTENAVVVEDNGDFWTNFSTPNGTDTLRTTMQSEWSYNVGVKGFKWDVANGGSAPANSALFLGTNWDKTVTSNKALAGVVVEAR